MCFSKSEMDQNMEQQYIILGLLMDQRIVNQSINQSIIICSV